MKIDIGDLILGFGSKWNPYTTKFDIAIVVNKVQTETYYHTLEILWLCYRDQEPHTVFISEDFFIDNHSYAYEVIKGHNVNV